MKKLFPGHFKEHEGELREVWNSSLFVFDANILLNLYRYSDATCEEFLRILNKLKDRIWIPHRVAEEYLENRLSVIGQQEKSYDSTKKSIESLRSDLKNARQHPFVSEKVMVKVNKVFDELSVDLDKSQSIHTDRILYDGVKEKVSSIFDNKVGRPYDESELINIINDGEERYHQKIPPGFKDANKSGDNEIFSQKCRKYGDLIFWMQVIDKAAEEQKGVVLVTDDKKEDWWHKFQGKTIGPHPELVQEFKEKAGCSFHMYQADRFLELARENLHEEVSEEIVEEIREISRRDKLNKKNVNELEYVGKREVEFDDVLKEMAMRKSEIMGRQEEIRLLERRKKELSAIRRSAFIQHDGSDDLDVTTAKSRNDLILSTFEELAEIEQKIESSARKYEEQMHRLLVLQQNIAYNSGF